MRASSMVWVTAARTVSAPQWRGELLQPRRAQLGGSDLGAQVADEAGEPVVGPHGQDDVPALVPAVDDLQQRVARALAVHVLGHGVVAARHGPAGVAVVALNGGDQEQFAFVVEHRGEDVEVREMAAAVVRVVGDDHVAGLQLVAEEVDGEADGKGARQHELGDADRECGQPALGVEDRGVPLVGLVQDRRRRRAGHVGRHFEADRLHGRSDDLCCDEIDLGGLRHGSPSGRVSLCCVLAGG